MRTLSRLVVIAALSIPVVALAAHSAAPLGLRGSIQFIGSKVTGSHNCQFKQWSGSVSLKDGKAEGGTLDFTVQTASVEGDVGNRNDWTGKLEEHLKSPDFFDVAKFPTATFKSVEIKRGGESGATHTIKGDLTMHGVTKRITFPATLSVNGKEVSGKAEFSINRKDFGIAYAGKADDLIRDGVVLKIDVRSQSK